MRVLHACARGVAEFVYQLAAMLAIHTHMHARSVAEFGYCQTATRVRTHACVGLNACFHFQGMREFVGFEVARACTLARFLEYRFYFSKVLVYFYEK